MKYAKSRRGIDSRNFPRGGSTQADLCRGFSCRAVDLELSFFEAAYTTRVPPPELGTA
jgi:hypothetical protein